MESKSQVAGQKSPPVSALRQAQRPGQPPKWLRNLGGYSAELMFFVGLAMLFGGVAQGYGVARALIICGATLLFSGFVSALVEMVAK